MPLLYLLIKETKSEFRTLLGGCELHCALRTWPESSPGPESAPQMAHIVASPPTQGLTTCPQCSSPTPAYKLHSAELSGPHLLRPALPRVLCPPPVWPTAKPLPPGAPRIYVKGALSSFLCQLPSRGHQAAGPGKLPAFCPQGTQPVVLSSPAFPQLSPALSHQQLLHRLLPKGLLPNEGMEFQKC